MRISTAYQFETYSREIAAAQERYIEAQRRVSSGKKLQVPSDDPLGSSVVRNYASVRASLEQYEKNLIGAKGYLGFTETALDETNTLLRRAYELAVRGASDTYSQESRNGMAAEVEELQQRLLALANSRGPGGRYLFAGQSDDAAPFTVSGGALTFSGDTNAISIEAGPGQMIDVNTSGSPLFEDAYAALESLRNNLIGGNGGAIGGLDIPALQAQMSRFTVERGRVGAKLQQTQALEEQHSRRKDELTARISDIEDVDLSEAITTFRLAETAYQAALGAASQGFRLSLLDFITG